ncbi:MAG: glycosyltransferase family 4 protein [Bacteroidales bacterium]|nr:glycosyltransferase family 4 protein [Bacteroidales bacterium]
MKIAVNTRLLLKNKLEGIGWFSYETLKRITTQHPEHQFYFLFDRPFDESFIFSGNITPVVIPPQARHPILYYLWFEKSVPRALKKIQPDLFFSPDGYLSLSTPFRSMNVFHDLNFEHYPDDLPYPERTFYRHYFPQYARKACRIATVSEFSRRDISNQYHVSPEKIDVVYNGANESYTSLSDSEKFMVRAKYTHGLPYFVFVGALHPRKNLANLFRAYDLFRSSTGINMKLLIIGQKKWWTRSIKEAFEKMKFHEDVDFCGRLEPLELNRVISAAAALTYVSYFEGFGIPILEAFYCETPVITSNVTSMPEVAGDAAILVDPFSVKSICEGMTMIATDPALSVTLNEKARERRKVFSWQRTADLLWDSVEKALDTKNI